MPDVSNIKRAYIIKGPKCSLQCKNLKNNSIENHLVLKILQCLESPILFIIFPSSFTNYQLLSRHFCVSPYDKFNSNSVLYDSEV